ncbi:MAG: GDP-mannose 4,6-dehydratase, partial [Armatimonadota bacterium]
QQVRDWLYAEDHARALDLLIDQGEVGEVYNIGAGEEHPNLEVVRLILDELGKPESLISFVKDRPGHDRRYSLDCAKLRALGWRPQADFEPQLRATIRWFAEHQDWMERSLARSKAYFEEQYRER